MAKALRFFALLTLQEATASRRPHIFFVLVDDLGWGEVGYHNSEDEVRTPHIDSLLRQGVELNRHYVHMECTPSRVALQSGRLPVHTLTSLAGPCDGNGAMPRNMTGLAATMKKAGYVTHQVGKWDVGMATPHHTPHGRGYDTSLNYFSHGNWMYSEAEWLGSYDHRPDVPLPGVIDFWDTDHPARHLNGTGYEEYIFRDRMLQILRDHDQSKPLFLQYDSKVAHYPLQAPLEYQERFSHVKNDNRRVYHAMVNFLDDQIANITGTMKELGMWDDTLFVFTTDNGGYVASFKGPCNTTGPDFPDAGESSDTGHATACFNGEAGGNNFPLRGGKYSSFEGGIRVNAFISGGAVPGVVRGSKVEGMMHIADWYRTLAQGVAGLDAADVEDVWAEKSDLPPLDSMDMWPMLSGKNFTSPRESIPFTDQLLIWGRWKYVKGHAHMHSASWGGSRYPNASTVASPISEYTLVCPAQGCLFDVVGDLGEYNEVSAEHPDLVKWMATELQRQSKSIWSTSHTEDPLCRRAAQELYSGFFGPWKEVGWQPADAVHKNMVWV